METITTSQEESSLRNRKTQRKGKSTTEETKNAENSSIVGDGENKQKLQRDNGDEPEKLKTKSPPANVSGQSGRESVKSDNEPRFVIRVQLDGASVVLFVLSFVTRFFRLSHPNGVV